MLVWQSCKRSVDKYSFLFINGEWCCSTVQNVLEMHGEDHKFEYTHKIFKNC